MGDIDKVEEESEPGLVTLEDIGQARQRLHKSGMVVRTPVLREVQALFPEVGDIKLHLKLENMQNTGSFKIRGVVNQLEQVLEGSEAGRTLVTMSAGNYGKAFAFYLQTAKTPGICVMPITVPESRVALIKSMGVRVEQCPSSEIQNTVDELVKDEGCLYTHSFDDARLIAGYGTLCLEVVEEEGLQPDVVVVCCGGGGLVSGIATAFHLTSKKPVRIYAVEPESANTMWESFRAGYAVAKQPKSIASGLSPPFAGKLCYAHCKRYVEDVILVTDEEIKEAMRRLLDRGLKAEPSGCAAMAAILKGRVPDVEGKEVLVVVTGGNVTVEEIARLLPSPGGFV